MRNIIRNNDGNTIIEFAVVAPMLFLLLMGIIEFGLIYFTNSAMEGATNIGSRIGKTGFTTGGVNREAYIRSEINRLSGGFLNSSKLKISILSYSSFSNIGQPEPCISPPKAPCPGRPGINFTDINGNGTWDIDQGSANAGGAGAIVLYSSTYPWSLFTPLISSFLGRGGIYTITATTAVRNEQTR